MTSHEPARPADVAALRDLVGQELGPTEWKQVTQADIDMFADVTGDRQWIHVDPDRAAQGPFGSTIAHGLLSLSLGPAFMEELLALDGFAHSLNYGYDKVRFMAPVLVDSRLRARAVIESVDLIGDGAAQVSMKQTIEREGQEKPVCVAVSVARVLQREKLS